MTYSLNISRELKNELNEHPALIEKLMLLKNGENSFTSDDMELFKSIASKNITVTKTKPITKRRSKQEIVLDDIEKTHVQLNRAKDMLEKKESELANQNESNLGYKDKVICINKQKSDIQKYSNKLAELNVQLNQIS